MTVKVIDRVRIGSRIPDLLRVVIIQLVHAPANAHEAGVIITQTRVKGDIMKRRSLLAVFTVTFLLLAVAMMGAAAGAGQGNGRAHVVYGLGIAKVQGQDALVEVMVEVPAGQPAQEAVSRALEAQGAVPLGSAGLGSQGFELTGLEWEQGDLPVVQYYNPDSEPVAGATALQNTHATWDGVSTSYFDINYGGTTSRCPSLVRECPGPQYQDGSNDVAWLKLQPGVLGVAWFVDDPEEVDIALSTRYDWVNDYDPETVLLHENGHLVGLGHSSYTAAVMYATYNGVKRTLHFDDEEGITYLYDSDPAGSISGTVTDRSTGAPISGAQVVLEGTGLSATTDSNGYYTIGGIPDPVTYTVTASAQDYESSTIDRLTVDGSDGGEMADFQLTPKSDGGGGPVCPPGKAKKGKC